MASTPVDALASSLRRPPSALSTGEEQEDEDEEEEEEKLLPSSVPGSWDLVSSKEAGLLWGLGALHS